MSAYVVVGCPWENIIYHIDGEITKYDPDTGEPLEEAELQTEAWSNIGARPLCIPRRLVLPFHYLTCG